MSELQLIRPVGTTPSPMQITMVESDYSGDTATIVIDVNQGWCLRDFYMIGKVP